MITRLDVQLTLEALNPETGPNPGWWTRGFDSGHESEFTRAPCLVGLW